MSDESKPVETTASERAPSAEPPAAEQKLSESDEKIILDRLRELGYVE